MISELIAGKSSNPKKGIAQSSFKFGHLEADFNCKEAKELDFLDL
jgi:hypothetical protein